MAQIKRTHMKKRTIIILIAAVTVLIAGYLVAAYSNRIFPFARVTQNYDPGTHVINEEKSKAEQDTIDNLNNNPDNKVENEQTDTPKEPTVNTNTGKKEAAVLITNVGVFNETVSASGFITNVVESSGACTYTFTNGVNKIVKQSKVLSNPSSTTCETVSFPVSELSVAGTWSLTLSYSSAESAGLSQAREFSR